MNQTQVNNFLRCLRQIDDLNYLALHTRASAIGGELNSSSAQNQHVTRGIFKDSNDSVHDRYGDDDHDHDHDASDSHDLLIAKVTAMVVLFCASALCGSIPFLLNRFFRWTDTHANARSETVVKGLLYFGGGVLLATTFLHLLPEVQEIVEQLQECNILPQLSFSLAELLMCIGFFLMYLIEELLHSYIHRHMRLLELDSGAGAAFERGRSIRNSYLVRGCNKADVVTEAELSKANDNTAVKLESNSDTKTAGILGTSVSDKSGRPGSLSVQNLIDDDLENQKYRQRQCKDDMAGKCQFEPQNKQKETYEPPQALHQPRRLQHQHHDHQQQQHGHSHLPLQVGGESDDALTSSLRGLFIVLALSLHELFEGMAIGLESNAPDVWFMFGAVSAHKLVLAFCVGVELIVANTRLTLSTLYILTFAVVSPIGIGIGILISHSEDTTVPSLPSAILQGLACGTLLYVVFFEILSKNHTGLITYLSLLVGFLVMFGLQQLGANGHGHSHGGCNASHDDHDHDDKGMLLKGVQDVYATQAPMHASRAQHQHHESSQPFGQNGSFERELQFLRQASDKLMQNVN